MEFHSKWGICLKNKKQNLFHCFQKRWAILRTLSSVHDALFHLNHTISQDFKVSFSHQGFTFHVTGILAEGLWIKEVHSDTGAKVNTKCQNTVSPFIHFKCSVCLLCVCTAELQVAARPWCSPVSQWPSEPYQTSAACWVHCRALGACVCPVCTQNLKRKNTSHFHLMNLNFTFISVYDGHVNAFVFSALVFWFV